MNLKTLLSNTQPETKLFAFTGSRGEILCTNHDRTPAFVRPATKTERGLFAADESFSITAETYRITTTGCEPDANAQWWISTDGGKTKTQCRFLGREIRSGGEFWWFWLQRN